MMHFAWDQALPTLSPKDRAVVSALRETALSLGCGEKMSPAGQKTEGVKFEYILKKPRRTLLILRVFGGEFTVTAKLFSLEAYQDVLAECTDRCKTSLLEFSGACGYHLGRCPGPVQVVIDGVSHPKCRHSLVFKGISTSDVPGIQRLLACEAEHGGQH